MPELPEVETVRCGLEQTVLRKPIQSLEIYLPRSVVLPDRADPRSILKGDSFSAVGRHGKYLLLTTESGLRFSIHLRMTGQLLYRSAKAEHLTHVRASFLFRDGSRLDFRDVRTFGRIRLIPENRTFRETINCGTDALEMTAGELEGLLKKHGKSSIKSFLLDQRRIAGIGNIYADEICHAIKTHPQASVGTVPSALLHAAVRATLLAAIDKGGTSFSDYRSVEGRPGSNQESLRVYGRSRCGSCGGQLEKAVVAGRTTRFCLSCQPLSPLSS